MAEGYESFLEQMKQGYQQRTGIPVDSASDVGIRFAVLAEQLALLQQELETAQQQAFAQTATGQALEMHAAQRGLSRKQAVYASGTAVFSREEAAQAEATSSTFHFAPIFPGFIRILSAPARTDAKAIL